MKKKIASIALVSIIFGFAVTGCGKGSSDSTSPNSDTNDTNKIIGTWINIQDMIPNEHVKVGIRNILVKKISSNLVSSCEVTESINLDGTIGAPELAKQGFSAVNANLSKKELVFAVSPISHFQYDVYNYDDNSKTVNEITYSPIKADPIVYSAISNDQLTLINKAGCNF